MQINAYLFFNGTCEAAFRFYEKVLGGKIVAMITHEEAPAEYQFAPERMKKIMHARLMVGDKVLMGSDTPADNYDPAKGFTVSLGVDTPAEAERIFADLAKGGTVRMPMAEKFFARKFGMLTDQFGTPWMVICEKRPA
jgi:PhnB protein